jgi:glycosyltransferase involved in cell wall biosynthesis
VLQASSSWVRRDFARILAQKFGHARWLIVGGERSAIEQQCAASGIAATLCPTALDLDGTSARNDSSRQFERAVWFYPASETNEQRDREVDVLAHQANDILLIPSPGAEVLTTRPELVERFGRYGFLPDYDCDLGELGPGAIRLLRRQMESAERLVPAVETAFARLHAQMRNLERTLRARVSELNAANRHIGKLEEKILQFRETKREVKQLKKEKQALRKSPERKVGQVLLAPYRLPQKLIRALRGRGRQARDSTARAADTVEYQDWFEQHRATPEQLTVMRNETRKFAHQPLISVITPVFNTPVQWLEEAVQSVLGQAYEDWELILVDDNSSDEALREYLPVLASRDSRIKVFKLEGSRGISAALNRGIEHARGEWIGFLDHDDLLEPDALFQTAKLLQQIPDADLIYSDEDKLTEAGFDAPLFKPDWSPDFFLSCNYLCHFITVRRELVLRVGGFRSEFDSAQDYDLLFRVIEQTDRIHHIPRVLYHWRRSGSSSAISPWQKPGQLEAARRAIDEHLQRKGMRGHVAIDWRTHAYWVKRELTEAKKISIIIPAGDRIEMLSRCIESITTKTNYPNYELVVVGQDNQSEEARSYFNRSKHRLLHYDGPFKNSAIKNFAVEQTKSPWLLFLDNDLKVIDGEWLSAMAEHIQRPEVGAVGARLLWPNDTVQHAGIVLGVGGVVEHAFRGFPAEDPGVFKQLQVTRNYSCVTGACLLTRRDVFIEVGGFDEERLPMTFNDVDLCLKMRRAGYLIVYTPFAKLYRHESAGHPRLAEPREAGFMRERWPELLQRDPYYNPNLSRERADFSLGN